MTDRVPPIPPEPPLSGASAASPPPAGQSVPGGPVPSGPVASEPAATSKERRLSPKLIITVLIVAIVLWFAFANTRNARINLWAHDVQAPVWLVLLCTFVAGILVGLLVSWRRSRARNAAD